MKIRNLTISAFGPYGKKQVLDFAENLKTDSMFVVTGNTGAGKTTIFDAINFALYGEASGASRETKGFRSNFATLDDDTFVELTFTLKGNEYKIFRSPEYMRKKKRGEGEAISKPKATLDINGGKGEPNGNTITGYTDVTNAVSEILGITSSQFKQLVMIPQGEFKRLLEAKSSEKEEIFRKIFRTDIINAFQENLKAKATELSKNAGELLNRRKEKIKDFEIDENSELRELILGDSFNTEVILDRFSKDIEGDKIKYQNDSENKEKIDKEIESLLKIYNEGKTLNKYFERVSEIKEAIKSLENDKENIEVKKQEKMLGEKAFDISIKEDEWKKVKNDLENSKKKLEDLKAEIKLKEKLKLEKRESFKVEEIKKESIKDIEIELEDLKKLKVETRAFEDKSKEVKDLEVALENLKEEKIKAEENAKKLNETLEKIQSYLEKCTLAKDKKITLEREKADIEKSEKSLEDIITKVDLALRIKEKKIINVSRYDKLVESARVKEQAYREAEDKLFRSQAGILAKGLKENNPCPVCGSLNHPNLAVIEDTDITKEFVDKLKLVFDKENKEVLQLRTEIKGANELLEERKEEINKLAQGLEFENSEIEQVKAMATEKLINIGEQSRACLLSFREVDGILSKEVVCKKKLEDILKAKEELEKGEVSLKQKTDEVVLEIKTNTRQIEEIKAKFNGEIKSLKQLNEREESILNEKIKIEKAYNIAKDALDNVNLEWSNLNGNLKGEQARLEELTKEEQTSSESFKSEILNNGFNGFNEYIGAKKTKEQLTDLDKIINDYNENVKSQNKLLEEYTEKIEGKNTVDLEEILAKGTKTRTESKALEEKLREFKSKINNNNKVLNDIEKINKDLEKYEEKFKTVGMVSKLVNGDNPKRITLERYILAAYLDDIINAANKRLLKMTNDRYTLLRKKDLGDKRVGQGLDLQVFDGYSNKEREITSLSGGEGFKASLAMALGLSDVVQAAAGGIQLDTMFIDEGFGTLDEESLSSAIDVLSDLQGGGRIVGVISHVNELKERIQNKIIVTGNKDGSMAKFN